MYGGEFIDPFDAGAVHDSYFRGGNMGPTDANTIGYV